MSGARNLVKNVGGAVTSLFRGPERRGRPAEAPEPEETVTSEAEDAALRSEIISRRARERSSTAGGAAQFLAQQRPGPTAASQLVTPSVERFDPAPLAPAPTPQSGTAVLTERQQIENQIAELQSQFAGQSGVRGAARRGRRQIGNLQRRLINL